MIMASRLVYGMAAQGIVPRGLGRVHGRRRTPWVAVVLVAVLAVALIALGDLESLADTTVLLLLMVFVCVNVAVLLLRREPVQHEHWRAPTALPVLGAVGVPRADRPEGGRGRGDLRPCRRAAGARRRAVGRQPGADGAA
jgi:APA family basic amino acid/polyamine antiporter